jgi:hypothetical protein
MRGFIAMVDGDDVGVLESRECVDLSLESADLIIVNRLQELDRDGALDAQALRAPHLAILATSEVMLQFKIAETVSSSEDGHRSHLVAA